MLTHRMPHRANGAATLLFTATLLLLMSATVGAGLHFLLFSRKVVSTLADREAAFRAAEAALIDAEDELLAAARLGMASARFAAWPAAGQCGAGAQAGLCTPLSESSPVWLKWLGSHPDALGIGVVLGHFSGATLPQSTGIPLAAPPRYLAEWLEAPPAQWDATDLPGQPSWPRLRVTAVGFGHTTATRAVVQSVVQP
jgi:type IV pilus assembly protein PilX